MPGNTGGRFRCAAGLCVESKIVARPWIGFSFEAPLKVPACSLPGRCAMQAHDRTVRHCSIKYRVASASHREAGTYFEELTVCYLKNEPAYRELYRDVVPYAVWAERHGLDKRDVGIDLVAETVTDEVHAIQCKLYAPGYRLQKADIDSFFTASGKKPFARG